MAKPKLVLTEEQKAIVQQIREQAERDRPGILEEGRRVKAADDISGVQLRNSFQLLAAYRKSRGVSLTALAGSTGISKGALSRLENNPELNVTLTTLTRVAEALNCNLQISIVPRSQPKTEGPKGRKRPIPAG